MKKKIKQLTKTVVLLFGIFLFFLTSCETDKETIQKDLKTEKKDYNVKRMKFSDFKANTKLTQKLTELQSSSKKGTSTGNSSKSNEKVYNVNTKEAIYIENESGTHHTYTFTISNQEGILNFENIILSLQDNGEYQAFLTTYILTEQERHDINLGLPIDLTKKAVIKKINDTQINYYSKVGGGCFDLERVGQEDCSCHTVHATGGCTHPQDIYAWVEVDCPGGGGGSGDGTGDGSGSGVGGGTSGGDGSGNNIPTIPMNPDGTSAAPSFLITALGGESQLSFRQISWINNEYNYIKVNMLMNFIYENGNTTDVKNFATELLDLLREDRTTDFNALNFIMKAYNQDKIYNAFDNSFLSSVNNYMNIDTNSTTDLTDPIYIHFITKIAVLKALNPEWSNAKVFWEATKDVIHIGLDIFGLVPVVGEVADLVNGAIYAIEGDGVNATLSLASAIPFVGYGSVATKYGLKIINNVTGETTKLVWKITANGVEFGSRSQLRKVLGLLPGNPNQAHHIIPWSLGSKDIVQKAARSNFAFHMNDIMNGIEIAAWRNQPNHNLYNDKVEALFDALPDNLTPNEAFEQVNLIITNIRNTIINNPNTHLNDLVF